MTLLDRAALGIAHRLDPERAHNLALKALQMGLGPRGGPATSPRLRTTIAGLHLPNPIGLAAGFDKNATALAPLAKSAFGFVEVGAATPRPQPGNPKPRLFRLSEDRAAINRFGFNNDGMEAIAKRLSTRPDGIVGLNLGANKDSDDRAADFARVLTHCAPFIDFATVNVSSPNTERLRELQGKDALSSLLEGVLAANEHGVPVFLKIAPDLDQTEIEDIVDVAQSTGIDGIIATNTTLARDGLSSPHAPEKGGLSGQPLFEKSTRVLAQISNLTSLPLIGVGGVANVAQAHAKLCAGASAVQLYTGLVYGGVSMISGIAHALDALLLHHGHSNVADIVGSKRGDWL